MKFLVSRTSTFGSKSKPCKNAFLESYDTIQTYDISEEEFNQEKYNGASFGRKNYHNNGKWREEGINHRVDEKGRIQRDFPNELKGWFIEINTLEELIDFFAQNGRIVIINHRENKNIIEIEIYDDWRE